MMPAELEAGPMVAMIFVRLGMVKPLRESEFRNQEQVNGFLLTPGFRLLNSVILTVPLLPTHTFSTQVRAAPLHLPGVAWAGGLF